MTFKKMAIKFSLLIATLGCMQLNALHAPVAEAFTTDNVNHILTVSPTGDYNQDARNALAQLASRSDTNVKWILKFNPGKYYLSLPLYTVGLKNVQIVSDPAAPAMLIKGPKFNPSYEYLFYARMGQGILLQGFEFYGTTTFQNGPTPVWPDQGVYFGSCRNVIVNNNKFFNFGDAALRITTSEADPVTGVDSINSTVTNNYFNNIYQVTTTSNDKIHGGSRSYIMEKNTFVNLRGSVKFATRTPGASDIHILNNVINGGDHFGLEVNNYSNMEIRGNNFENIKGVAINIYTAGDKGTLSKGFQWCDNFTLVSNVIKSSGRAIRVCPSPFFDGTTVTPHQLTIANNTINTISEPNREVAAIEIINGKVDGLKITGNQMFNIASKKYIHIAPGSTLVTQASNKADGSLLNNDASNLTVNDTKPPIAPTNLGGKYEGNLTVMLNWTDNAPDESAEEVWASLDGKKYNFIAKLSPQSTKFKHILKRLPPTASLYYAVKAVNKNGASPLSPACKVAFPSSNVASSM